MMGAIERDSAGWQFDKFDDDSPKIVKEVQLRKYGSFLNDYSTQLKEIEKALGETVGDAWDMTLDPISLQFLPYEHATILQLTNTDNKMFNKVMTVLASLCCEMSHLKHEAQTRFFNSLQFYGEADPENAGNEGEAQIQMGRMISVLQELSCYVTRCYEVVRTCLQQMSALYSTEKQMSQVLNVSGVHFQVVYEHLADLLQVLVTLDSIIENQTTLKEHWKLYKRMLKSVRHNPEKFGLPENKIRPFEKLLMTLEGQILDGFIFQNCVQQTFDQQEPNIGVSSNNILAEDFSANMRNYFAQIEPHLGKSPKLTSDASWSASCAFTYFITTCSVSSTRKLSSSSGTSIKRFHASCCSVVSFGTRPTIC
jgi:WASH complex subunit 7